MAHAGSVRLDGPLSQGGLVIGHTVPGASVLLNAQMVRVDQDGVFLLGFGRNAKPQAVLEITQGDGARETRNLKIAQREWKVQRINGLPKKQVTPDPKIIKRIRADNTLIYEVRALDTDVRGFEAGFAWPISGIITGVYGSQRILNDKPRSPHNGIDIAAAKGTPIVAFADGVVELVHHDMFYTGKTMMIDHGHGLSSVYAHMSAIDVDDGQRVMKGQIIGRVGKTGRATGYHLHWGLSLFTTHLDPGLLLPPMVKSYP